MADGLSDDERGCNSSDGSGESSATEDEEPAALNWCWSDLNLDSRRFPFTRQNELLVSTPGNNTPLDWFFLLLDDNFLEYICQQTNRNFTDTILCPDTSDTSRINNWKELTVSELKIFLGLLFHTGTIRMDRFQNYWRTHRMFNLPFFRQYMARDRFLAIFKFLNFADEVSPSNLQPGARSLKIAKLVDFFNNKMDEIYYPSRELIIDEPTLLSKGQLLFGHNTKTKRLKYDIKLYSLSEPYGLTVKFFVYTGSCDILAGRDHTSKVVLKLMEGKLGYGHSLFVDQFYNSVPLAATLLSAHTYCTGTLRVDRIHNPAAVTDAPLRRGETVAQYAKGVMVGKWRDRRTFLYISSEFENEVVTVTSNRRQTKEKPIALVQYSANMAAGDRLEQMQSYYPCERHNLQWHKKVFVHLIQIIMMNAYHLYNMHQPLDKHRLKLYEFRMQVLESLLPPVPKPCRMPTLDAAHRLVKNDEQDVKGGTKRKKCRVCYKGGKRKQSTFVCGGCPDKPGLCPVECFDNYHKDM